MNSETKMLLAELSTLVGRRMRVPWYSAEGGLTTGTPVPAAEGEAGTVRLSPKGDGRGVEGAPISVLCALERILGLLERRGVEGAPHHGTASRAQPPWLVAD